MRERQSREMSGESRAGPREAPTASKFSVISLPMACSSTDSAVSLAQTVPFNRGSRYF